MKLKNLLSAISFTIIISILILSAGEIIRAENYVVPEEKLSGREMIEYQLKLVRIDERDIFRFGLDEVRLKPDMQDVFSFIAADNIIQMTGIASRALFELQAYHASERSIEMASPTVITLPGETAELKLAEEITHLQDELTGGRNFSEQMLVLTLLAERQDESGRVLTDLRVKSGATSTVETKFWSEQKDPQLVGIVNWTRETTMKEQVRGGDRTEVTTFALYAGHELIDADSERRQNIISLGGLNEILWPPGAEEITLPGYIQYLTLSDIEMLLIDNDRNTAFVLKTENILTDRGPDNIRIGFDRAVYEDLRLGLRLIKRGEAGFRFAPSLTERVEVNPYLLLAGGYYPVFYSIYNDGISAEHAFWGEITLRYNPLSARLRYSSNLAERELRGLVGYDLSENLTLLFGAVGSRDNFDRLVAGINISF